MKPVKSPKEFIVWLPSEKRIPSMEICYMTQRELKPGFWNNLME